jgi:hypothetical protein
MLVGSRVRRLLACALALGAGAPAAAAAEPTQLFFGDTHVHTSASLDAHRLRNRSADPDTAFQYARGLPVVHPYTRARVQLAVPLDFLVVADHAEYLGVVPRILAGDPLVAMSPTAQSFFALMSRGNEAEAYAALEHQLEAGQPDPVLVAPELRRAAWNDVVAAAERHYDPGRFTTLLGWEWSGAQAGASLHRVVILREGRDVASRFLPFSALDGARPEDLWAWLDTTATAAGATFLAIPHASGTSRGLMFVARDASGEPVTADYARTRRRWEPVVEVTQTLGDVETHPRLSPEDGFADFERPAPPPAGHEAGRSAAGDFVRSALGRGLEIEARTGENSYRFGLIGSTDAHTALGAAEESEFQGAMALDSTPETKDEEIAPGVRGWDVAASGLAAVWATANTREALFDALQRREVYATTGTRLRVRFFGGWDFAEADAQASDLAERGYARGVPMGGALPGPPRDGVAPTFLVHAARGRGGANLDRIQIVKGWLEADGRAREIVHDVALSGERAPGPDGRIEPVKSSVDLQTGRWTNTTGAAQLAAAWSDPEFEPSQRAFYYVRVLQIPTPRHTLADALALGVPHPERLPAVIQERAYTSPIWYTP